MREALNYEGRPSATKLKKKRKKTILYLFFLKPKASENRTFPIIPQNLAQIRLGQNLILTDVAICDLHLSQNSVTRLQCV